MQDLEDELLGIAKRPEPAAIEKAKAAEIEVKPQLEARAMQSALDRLLEGLRQSLDAHDATLNTLDDRVGSLRETLGQELLAVEELEAERRGVDPELDADAGKAEELDRAIGAGEARIEACLRELSVASDDAIAEGFARIRSAEQFEALERVRAAAESLVQSGSSHLPKDVLEPLLTKDRLDDLEQPARADPGSSGNKVELVHEELLQRISATEQELAQLEAERRAPDRFGDLAALAQKQDAYADLAARLAQERAAADVASALLSAVSTLEKQKLDSEIKVMPRQEVGDKVERDASPRDLMGGSAKSVAERADYEWLHLRAVSHGGPNEAENLVAGSGVANVVMMYFENALRQAKEEGRKVETEVAAKTENAGKVGVQLLYRAWIDGQRVLEGSLDLATADPLAKSDVAFWLGSPKRDLDVRGDELRASEELAKKERLRALLR
jgi:hypothetical protein